ncbi:cytochrome P450 4V2-like [Rhodnius prolixus]|uniref:cytochrome P450 4V2-like n=1 Tax=Rhodnius prolixus TaxID=13249 RepID=UPI003D18B41C
MIVEFLLLILLMAILLMAAALPLHLIDLRPKTIWKMSKLPGPRGLPFFIGLAIRLAKLRDIDILAFFQNIHQEYARLVAFWLAGIPTVWLFDPDDLEVILASSQAIQKGNEYHCLFPWMQDGLVLSKGEKWHQRRKLLTPAFHFKILENNMQSLNKNARCLLRNMLKKEGRPFVTQELVVRCTLDVISETAMGHSLNLQEREENNDYLNAVERACSLTFDRSKNVFYSNDWVYFLTLDGRKFSKNLKYLHNFSENIIQNRKLKYLLEKKYSENNIEEDNNFGKGKKAFLDILIDLEDKSKGTLTDKDIREEVDNFMFAGHDTTASCIMFTLYLLGRHPHVQEKAFEELYEIFGESDREVNNKDLHGMHYLEMIIKESIRIYPPAPYFSRNLIQDLVLKDKTVLPEGANVGIFAFIMHRDPKYFPNPEVFDPERFSAENCKKRHPYAYLPFSAGPRNCIGQKFAMMELKVVLSTILRFAKIESVNDEISARSLTPLILLKPCDPIRIKVFSRF